MNIPRPASIKDGTVLQVIQLPPWPVQKPVVLVSFRLADGALKVNAEPTGRLRAVVSSDGGATHEVMSCPIVVESPRDVILAVRWQLPEIDIRLNGIVVGSTHPDEQPPGPFVCAPNKIHDASEMEVLSAQNLDKQKKRHFGLAGWQPRPGRIQGDAEYRFSTLRDEALAIRELLAHIESGGMHHVPGLAGSLRKLIVEGKPMPLLQQCAATIDAPLIVYTVPRISLRCPVQPALNIKLDIASVPNRRYPNPIDLDLWLDQHGGTVSNRELTHRELLMEIGSTIGAHFDHDMRPSVFFMRAIRTEVTKVPLDMVANYLGTVATAALQLAESLLIART